MQCNAQGAKGTHTGRSPHPTPGPTRSHLRPISPTTTLTCELPRLAVSDIRPSSACDGALASPWAPASCDDWWKGAEAEGCPSCPSGCGGDAGCHGRGSAAGGISTCPEGSTCGMRPGGTDGAPLGSEAGAGAAARFFGPGAWAALRLPPAEPPALAPSPSLSVDVPSYSLLSASSPSSLPLSVSLAARRLLGLRERPPAALVPPAPLGRAAPLPGSCSEGDRDSSSSEPPCPPALPRFLLPLLAPPPMPARPVRALRWYRTCRVGMRRAGAGGAERGRQAAQSVVAGRAEQGQPSCLVRRE